MVAKPQEQVVQEFREAVNMSPDELQDFLQSDESKGVGQVRTPGWWSGRRLGRAAQARLD